MKFAYIALLAASVSAVEKPLEFTQTYAYNSTKANVTAGSYYNPDTNVMITEMRSKFEDYFAYSMEAKNVTDTAALGMIVECSTSG